MADKDGNEVAPTLDLTIKIAFSKNANTQVQTGIMFASSPQPMIEARVPFRYDAFSDNLKVPDEINIGPWRGLIKSLIRFHGHVYEVGTLNLVTRTNELLAEKPEEPPPFPMPGDDEVKH